MVKDLQEGVELRRYKESSDERGGLRGEGGRGYLNQKEGIIGLFDVTIKGI
jgi:hypothetical protein